MSTPFAPVERRTISSAIRESATVDDREARDHRLVHLCAPGHRRHQAHLDDVERRMVERLL